MDYKKELIDKLKRKRMLIELDLKNYDLEIAKYEKSDLLAELEWLKYWFKENPISRGMGRSRIWKKGSPEDVKYRKYMARYISLDKLLNPDNYTKFGKI